MAMKLVILLAAVACARAAVIGAALGPAYGSAYGPAFSPYGPYGPVAKVGLGVPAVAKVAVADYDPNPHYSYSYDIQDALTGDNKGQQETRSGDVVDGSYSLVQPDGLRRTVQYTANPVNGFNAVVHYEPAAAPVVAKAVVPVAKPLYPGLAHGVPAVLGHGYPGFGGHYVG